MQKMWVSHGGSDTTMNADPAIAIQPTSSRSVRTLLICIPVLAQTSPPAATRDNTFPATHGSGAEGEGLKQKHFEIKSCALSEALRAYADQTGEQVVFFSDVGKDQQSVEVAGTYTNDAVLSRMLSKSGLTFERLNPHTIAITSNSRTTAAKTSLMYQTSLSRDEGKGLLRLAQNSSSDTPARNRPSADAHKPTPTRAGLLPWTKFS